MKLKPSWQRKREMVMLGEKGMFVAVWTSSPPSGEERILLGAYEREVERRGFPFMLVDPGQKVHPTWIPVVAMGVPDLGAVYARTPEISELPTEQVITNFGLRWQQSGQHPEMLDVVGVLDMAKRFKDAETDEELQRTVLAEAEMEIRRRGEQP